MSKTLPTTASDLPHIVVIGASFGGVTALLDLAGSLPAAFPAIVAVVLHIGPQHSILPELLSRRGPLPARHAHDGEAPVPGTIYVAPPDQHLLAAPEGLRLSRGPREDHARPAIDPLFRSAALGWRERAIGVVLTGELDDGTAGLEAIKACGGIAVVQDPSEAVAPSMPSSALAHVPVDHCVPIPRMGTLLADLVRGERPASHGRPPGTLVRERTYFNGNQPMQSLALVAAASQLTCHQLQASVRSLKEREMMLRRLAMVAHKIGDEAQAAAGRVHADRIHDQVERLSSLIRDDLRSA